MEIKLIWASEILHYFGLVSFVWGIMYAIYIAITENAILWFIVGTLIVVCYFYFIIPIMAFKELRKNKK